MQQTTISATNTPLLEKLKKLEEVDRALSFDPQNPIIYRKRALLFQELGCTSLSNYDNQIYAYLTQSNEAEKFIHKITFSEEDFANLYQSESDTPYYQFFFDILKNDKALLTEYIDPIHFALRSGNAINLGLLNLSLRDCNDAIKYLEKFPQEQAIATLNKALLLLLVGDYQMGWALYEKRWETHYKSFKNPMSLPRPLWQGEPLDSQSRLLICSEQGIGDNIQFVRYAIYLKQQGIDVLVWNNSHIDDFLTFNLSKHGITTAKLGDEVQFSHWVRMMSLPYLCGTTIDNIPFNSRYLIPSLEYLQKWKEKLPLIVGKPKIGIVWRGGSNTDNDKIRSIPLTLFSQLFSSNADFYVLQKEVNATEADILRNYPNVYDFHSKLDSFFDTSAIVEQMDLMICVDTSVAHLSAAMGKATWILINYKPDFRWLLFREDSIWYQSVRLFRQDLDYDWEPVIQKIHQELLTL
ncbi:glycosyltransferase [Mannheimia glucosida]|uniref:glycosyltransferase n=1 Tax=Mannheimia glucosida TaxID=85401 RepID=UPI00391802D9